MSAHYFLCYNYSNFILRCPKTKSKQQKGVASVNIQIRKLTPDLVQLKLGHGGIMPNYECSAACRHCLYSCSPTRTGGYMTEPIMDATILLLKEGGCRSVHIGGGEPFLDFDGLLTLCKKAANTGIAVDYVETNASWATDEETITRYLTQLRKVGVDTLCISVDPFHAEYVPYANPLRLAQVCQMQGFGCFLWQDRFLAMMQNISPHTAHSRALLEKGISQSYINDTANAYGIRYGGRAINIAMEYRPLKPAEELLAGGVGKQCNGLVSGGHYHVDMHGRFIPPGCTGYVIPLEEIVRGVPDGKYPVFEASLSGGSVALYELATSLGFIADAKGYPSRCELCFFMRKYLSEHGDHNHNAFAELDKEHFEQAMLYYPE